MNKIYYREPPQKKGINFDLVILLLFAVGGIIGLVFKFIRDNPILSIITAIIVLVMIFYLVKYLMLRKITKLNNHEIDASLKPNEQKVAPGELKVGDKLNKLNIYKRLVNGIYIPLEDGKTIEIDTVMIANSGIYVINFKNFNGWVYGNSGAEDWTITINRKSNFKFSNPIWQNKLHISSLAHILEIKENNFESLIVFGKNAILKDIEMLDETIKITNIEGLETMVYQIDNAREKKYSNKDVDILYEKLKQYKYVDETEKKRYKMK